MSARNTPSHPVIRSREQKTKRMRRLLLRVAAKGIVYGATSSLGATVMAIAVSWLRTR